MPSRAHFFRTLALIALVLTMAAPHPVSAFADEADAWAVPMRPEAWELPDDGFTFARHLGRDALHLQAGRAWIAGAEFENGTIEFDVAISEEQAFSGVAFRAVDRRNFENFYIRHHLSGMPDATQYQPVYNGLGGWQIYAGPGFTAAADWVFGRWMHVRVDVSGDRAAVYIDSTEPVMVIDDLQRDPATGGIALNAGNAWFASMTIRAGDPEIPTAEATEAAPDHDASDTTPITSWQVSNPFAEDRVDGAVSVTAAALGLTGWNALEATHRGIANLARVAVRSPAENTVVAAVTLRSDREQVVRMRYGFSDRVRVYVGGRLLAGGADVWQSRDYRFLGTIGLFDEVALPLREGDNEVWFAVSEDFGGWGVTAELVDVHGVTIR